MPATTFSPIRTDKTFSIAIAMVAVLGAAEVIAVGWHFFAKTRAARQAETATHAIFTPAPTAAATAAPAASAPAVAQQQPPATTTQSTPSSAALSVAERLLKEAAQLREAGDTNNALARLQDASQRDPKNANVLAEMAMIYESIGALDRSNETWRKIADIGPSAGALWELADMKLKMGVAPAPATTSGPGFAGVSPLDAGSARGDPEGIPDGSTFGISEASVSENPDADTEANLTLRVGVKKRPNSITDHTKVKIQVYFYDTVENNKVALTDAEVNYEWLTPNHDWKATNPEVLAVSYIRLKKDAISSEQALAEAAASVVPGKKAAPKKSPPPAGSRKYAGYQVRVYYNDQLQDVRAEPTKLLNLFPPPLTLTSQ